MTPQEIRLELLELTIKKLEEWLDNSSEDVDDTELQGYMQAQDEVDVIIKKCRNK
jgi:hypothetical protein